MAVLLICIILCVLEGATAAATCELLWGANTVSDTGAGVNITVDCLPSGLSITWQVKNHRRTAYNAEVNYICTDTTGINTEGYIESFNTNLQRQGSIETDSLIQNVIRNGGECTIYGCTELTSGSFSSHKFTYIHNQTCEYTQPATEVRISSTTDEISSTSTSVQNSETPLGETITFPTDTPSAVATPGSLSSASEETATSGPEIPASSQTHAAVTLTPRKGSSNTTAIIVTIVVLFAFFILTMLFIGLFLCKKKKNSRFQNLGISLHVDAEKIDPFDPIEVESYIKKCESMGSIFEYLTLYTDKEKKQATKFTLPVNNSILLAKQPKEAEIVQDKSIAQHSYTLQPPTLQSDWTESIESSDGSSDYQSSNTSIITTSASPHLEENTSHVRGHSDGGCASSLHCVSLADGHETIACSNLLFEQKLCRTCSSSSEYSYSSHSTTGLQTYSEDRTHCESHFNGKPPFTSDLDELILGKDSDTEGSLDLFRDNRVVLTFSSSLSCNENVIIIKAESDDSDDLSYDSTQEIQSLPEDTNLTINPHHFDPL